MSVPRNFVFRENIAHSTLIVIGVVVVIQSRVDISVIIAGRSITIAITITIVTIPVSVAGVAGVVGWIGIRVGPVRVGPVPSPPGTPPPWRGEVADKDNFVEMLKATKPISLIKLFIVEMVKASKAQG